MVAKSQHWNARLSAVYKPCGPLRAIDVVTTSRMTLYFCFVVFPSFLCLSLYSQSPVGHPNILQAGHTSSFSLPVFLFPLSSPIYLLCKHQSVEVFPPNITLVSLFFSAGILLLFKATSKLEIISLT